MWVLLNSKVTRHDDLYIRQVVSNHLLKGPLHFISKNIEGSLRIVSLTIIPNQLNMIQHLLNSTILSSLQLFLYLEQVHRVLDHQWIIIEL